uniref:Uncharacterized protein n=1 Tax=Spongospora subterranea TaxID=70186 RepID=A0A0H5R4G2_9EUKA|eukprot:CRZ09095.1 hypothetical protein [Spongospora subterranea]
MVTYGGSYGEADGHGSAKANPTSKMAILKEVTTSSTVAWCPLESKKTLLASGTVSGTIDDTFQTSSRLVVFDASLADQSPDMQAIGQARVKDADFVRIGWGAKGSSDSSMPLGLIAGGMSDGSVLLWNANAILEGQNRPPVVAKRHSSHVSGLAFHPSEQNLIASGSSDSELLIWDLKNFSSPIASPPGPPVTTDKSSIVDVAWNLKVPHILACSTSNGQTSVWDLRQKRAVITFTESSHRHVPATAVSWDPTQARQLVVSYAYPAAEVWDLRYGMAPKQILQGGHSRGSILTVAWSQHDSDIILTTGEDATTCIWNSQNGELLESIQDRGTTFCMRWHPFTPELLAGSTYEGTVNIRSISNMGRHVPAWKGRPCGAIFGFGSRLVCFGNGQSQTSLQCFKVSTEPEFVRLASEFQNHISQTDLRTFCSQKIAHAGSDDEERATWEFLRILLDGDSRSQLLRRLGFSLPKQTASSSVSNGGADSSAPVTVTSPRFDDVSDEDFFNQLSPAARAPTAASSALGVKSFSLETNKDNTDEVSSLDRNINSMLVVGDIEGAALLCVQNQRMADALTIAALGSGDFHSKVLQLYTSSHNKHYIRSIAACIRSKDISTYVQSSDLSQWKETLALTITYCDPERFLSTVRMLVDRLEKASMNQAAILCCLCSNDVDGASILWQKQDHQRHGKARIHTLQDSVEKLFVMTQACGQTCGPTASGLYAEYAGLLSAQGAMSMALSFLHAAGNQSSELAYRIFYSGVPPSTFPAPPQPFYVHPVAGSGAAYDANRGHPPGRANPAVSASSWRSTPGSHGPGDSKPSSVPPQNRMVPPNVARRQSMSLSRNPTSPSSRHPHQPSSVLGSTRPNSLPPGMRDDRTGSLPSRHLLPQGQQTTEDHRKSAPSNQQFRPPPTGRFGPPGRGSNIDTNMTSHSQPPSRMRPSPDQFSAIPQSQAPVRSSISGPTRPDPSGAMHGRFSPAPAAALPPSGNRFGPTPTQSGPVFSGRPDTSRIPSRFPPSRSIPSHSGMPQGSGPAPQRQPPPIRPTSSMSPGPSAIPRQMSHNAPQRPISTPHATRGAPPFAGGPPPSTQPQSSFSSAFPSEPIRSQQQMAGLPGGRNAPLPGPRAILSTQAPPSRGRLPPSAHPPQGVSPNQFGFSPQGPSAPSRPITSGQQGLMAFPGQLSQQQGMQQQGSMIHPQGPTAQHQGFPSNGAMTAPGAIPQQQGGPNQQFGFQPSGTSYQKPGYQAQGGPPLNRQGPPPVQRGPSQQVPLRQGPPQQIVPQRNPSNAPVGFQQQSHSYPPQHVQEPSRQNFQPPSTNSGHIPQHPSQALPPQSQGDYAGQTSFPGQSLQNHPARGASSSFSRPNPAPLQRNSPFVGAAPLSSSAMPGRFPAPGQSQKIMPTGRMGVSPPRSEQSQMQSPQRSAAPAHFGPTPPVNRGNQQFGSQHTQQVSSQGHSYGSPEPQFVPASNQPSSSAYQGTQTAFPSSIPDTADNFSSFENAFSSSSDSVFDESFSHKPVRSSPVTLSSPPHRSPSPSRPVEATRFEDAQGPPFTARSNVVPSHSSASPHHSPPRSSSPRQMSPSYQTSGSHLSPNPNNDLVGNLKAGLTELSNICQNSGDQDILRSIASKFESELYNRILAGSLSPGATQSLQALAKALLGHNKGGVQQANIALITDSWGEVKTIIPSIKSIVEVCKKNFE